jgi:hypothetical protein
MDEGVSASTKSRGYTHIDIIYIYISKGAGDKNTRLKKRGG